MGDLECNGEVPCVWRGGCRIYRDFCVRRQVDPELEKSLLPARALLDLVYSIMHAYIPAGGQLPDARIMRGWDRYLAAFQAASHRPLVHPMPELAAVGELYIVTWGSPREGFPLAKILRVRQRRTYRFDPVLTRYYPRLTSRVEPTIEFRCPMDVLFTRYPQAKTLARRWRVRCRFGTPIGCVAVRVKTDRIEDAARLVARLLEGGLTTGMRLKAGRVVFGGR